MAVAFEGFSIREYASRMRAVDVAKCWPFDGGPDDESSLPPITVRKFRWWSDELELSRDRTTPEPGNIETESMEAILGEKLDCVCADSKGNEVISNAKRKGKSRAPKKRSIVEIFAVAPQVERLGCDDEEEEEEVDEEDEVRNSKVLALCDVGLEFDSKEKMKKKGKKKPKLKHELVSNLKKGKLITKVKKKSPKKGRDCVNLLVQSIAKKEKPRKLKLQSRIIYTSKPNRSVCSEKLGKNLWDIVSIQKKKPRLKCLVTPKKKKLVKSSKLIKLQKSVFPVRGILKNHNEGFPGELSTPCNLKIGSQVNQCGILQSDRHVSFSDMDQTLGPRRKPSVECSKMKTVYSSNSDAIPASSVKDHDMKQRKSLAIPGVNGSDEDVSISTENETQVQPASTKQPFDTCRRLDVPNFLRPHMGRQELFDRSATLNQVALSNENFRTFKQGYRDASHVSYDGSPRFLSLLKEGYNPSVNTQMGADNLRDSNTSNRLIELESRDPTCSAALPCSMEYAEAFSRPSSSYFVMNGNANGKLPYPARNTPVDYGSHAMQYQPFCHFSPKELMRSICSFPDWKQRAAMGEEKLADEGFCGLPLNSQGELIQMNSSGNGVFNQLMGTSCLDQLNFRDGGAPTKDHLNVFPVWKSAKGNPNLNVSSRVGVCRIQGGGRKDVHPLDTVQGNYQSVYHLESDLEQMNISRHGQKQVQNQVGDGKGHQQGNPGQVGMHVTQPTMRLMGKEFTVGSSSEDLQAFDDGKVWTDKQIIAEHRPTNTAVGSSSLERQFQQDMIVSPASGKSKENVPYLTEFQIYQASQSTLQMKPPGSRFYHPYLNCQKDTETGYPNCYAPTHGNGITTLRPHIPSSFASPAPRFQDPFIIQYESPKVSRMPAFSFTPQGNMASNSPDLQYKQKLPHATKSAFEFPFLRPDCEEHVQPSLFQNSSTSLPPWLISATQQKETSFPSRQSYSVVGGRNHPSTMPVQNAPEVRFPYHPAFSQSAVHNSVSPASYGPPPAMPLCREFIPMSPMNHIHGERMKFRERLSPRIRVKEPGQDKKTRKRAAAKSTESPKPTKIPNWTVHGDNRAEIPLKDKMPTLELDSITDNNARNVSCEQTEIRTDGLGVSLVGDTFKMDGIPRSGPIRLSAGAKHILKPSSNTNQDNSRPIHSTIPFAAPTSSARVSESEKKSEQIYRF